MALPSIRTYLTSSAPVPNTQDPSAIAHVVGPASKGPIDVPMQIDSFTALRDTFGDGPGPEQTGEQVSTAGFPVYFTRSATTTPGAVQGGVTETGEGVAENVYGAIILPGADANGRVLFRSLQAGVTLTVVQGLLAGYAVAPGTRDITLTVVAAATTGASIVALALGAAAGLIAPPVNSGSSTGASLCDQAVAVQAFDNGTIVYTAKGGGAYLVPGADGNGGVIYRSSQKGVSVRHVVAGMSSPLTVARVGSELWVNLETDGAGAVASSADAVVEAVTDSEDAQSLGIAAQATGTGNSLSAAIGSTSLGRVQIAHVTAGLGTALSAALSGRTVTVNSATDADGNATSTATQILAKLADAGVPDSVNASFVLTAALLGDGTELGGPQAAMDLDWGSSGTAVLSGTPNDAYHLQIEILRGGVVGTQPYPTLRWAVDYLAGESVTPSWTGAILIPATGTVELKNSSIDTGLTVTLSGTLGVGTIFGAWTSAPQSGIADLGTAVDAAIAERRFGWGFLTGPDSISRSEDAILNAKLEAAFVAGTRPVQGLWCVRDRGEGVPGETVDQYKAAIEADYLGFVAARGRTTMCAGAVLHASPYTLRQFRRPTVFAAAARKGSIPIHENFGKVGSGPLTNVLHLFYDEGLNPGLFDARFVVPMTYPQRPGFFYLAGSPTMADAVAPADAGYTLYERSAIANQITRIAQLVALQYLNDSLPGMARADTARGIVAGAIDTTAKGTIESRASKAVDTFLFARKSDGKASASPLPPGEKSVTVRQDNNFLNDRTIYMDIKWIPLGLAQHIVITVNTTIPG